MFDNKEKQAVGVSHIFEILYHIKFKIVKKLRTWEEFLPSSCK